MAVESVSSRPITGAVDIMNELHEPVKTCAAVGHVYSSVVVIRCQHRESYTVAASAWRDTPDGYTHVLWDSSEEFGPFDDLNFIATRIGALMREAVAEQMLCTTL